MINNYVVGADPELFLMDSKGNLKSSIGLIGGSKEHPLKVDNNGHALQEDNVAVEYNIPPTNNENDFVTSNKMMLKEIEKRVKTKYSLSLAITQAALFPPDELNHPQAMAFACIPDYNVYTGRANIMPQLVPPFDRLRSAGGHIHIGWSVPNAKDRKELIKAMDLFFSIPMTLIEPPNPRRALYGKAGCFRGKKYGVEYRTPSNYWLTDESLMRFAFKSVGRAIEFVNSGKTVNKSLGEQLQKAINSDNVDLASTIAQTYL